jgi:Ca2+-transporting ATPase
MVVYQMVHVGNCRSERRSAFRKSVLSNPVLLIGTLISMVVHVGALYWQPTQALLQLEPLQLESWLRILAISLSVLVVVELHKIWTRRTRLSVENGAARVMGIW